MNCSDVIVSKDQSFAVVINSNLGFSIFDLRMFKNIT